MKNLHLFFFAIFINLSLFKAQSLYFPPLTGSVWDTISPQRLNWCQSRIDSLYNYLQIKNTKSFIILKDGKIVLEKYFGAFNTDSLFYWASASKSLASFITGIAQQKNLININNNVSQYLGVGWTNESPAKENLIKIKDLLQMTSGMEDNPPSPCDNEDTAKTCLFYKVDAGTRWAYHTGAYKKVQSVVSAAAGQNYNLVTNNWIESATGMSGLWINQTYYSKARDMARFGLLILNQGIWNTDTLLKDQTYFNAMVNTSQTYNPSYGYLWWLNGKSGYLNPGLPILFNGPLIPNAAPDMFCALGKNDQKIYVTPSSGFVVIRQGNSADGVTFALSNFDNNLWGYINKLGCSTTGENNLINQDLIAIYPNPSCNEMILKTPVSIRSVMFENAVGIKFKPNLNNKTVDVSGFSKGTYIVTIVLENDQQLIKKVILD